jgi:hypothetical protein
MPSPRDDTRDLQGSLETEQMLPFLHRRINEAVQRLVARTLAEGGRIVHGGHPSITPAIALQASNWSFEATFGQPPILIYQSELFVTASPPPGRREMEESGIAAIRWVPVNFLREKDSQKLPHRLQELLRPRLDAYDCGREVTADIDNRRLQEALLALRVCMLIETKPLAAVCVGGMGGLLEEASLFAALTLEGILPPGGSIHALQSTYGAAGRLRSDLSNPYRVLLTIPDAAKADGKRLNYDSLMANLIRDIAAHSLPR